MREARNSDSEIGMSSRLCPFVRVCTANCGTLRNYEMGEGRDFPPDQRAFFNFQIYAGVMDAQLLCQHGRQCKPGHN